MQVTYKGKTNNGEVPTQEMIGKRKEWQSIFVETARICDGRIASWLVWLATRRYSVVPTYNDDRTRFVVEFDFPWVPKRIGDIIIAYLRHKLEMEKTPNEGKTFYTGCDNMTEDGKCGGHIET